MEQVKPFTVASKDLGVPKMNIVIDEETEDRSNCLRLLGFLNKVSEVFSESHIEALNKISELIDKYNQGNNKNIIIKIEIG